MTDSVLKDTVNALRDKLVVEDLRQPGKVKFPLVPALFAIITAWCSGCNNAVAVADYLCSKRKILAEVIEGLPANLTMSHDTVLRMLKAVKFSELQSFLSEFCLCLETYQQIKESSEKRILSMDGQTPRAMVYAPVEGAKCPDDRRQYNRLYYVTLYDSTNKMAIAQDEVAVKENENKSCVRLLKMFSLSGSIVTADALNTQRSVAKAIIEQDGEYCLAVKDNHKKLNKAIRLAFEGCDDEYTPLLNAEKLGDFETYLRTYRTPVELGHGRVEEREIQVLPADFIKDRVLGEWAEDCECIVKATTYCYDKKYKLEKEPIVRYYVCSINPEDEGIAETVYRAVREHWHIENSLHWRLDIDFGQDWMQVKSRDDARNRLLLNKLALNILTMLQPEYSKKSEKISMRRLMLKLRDDPELAINGIIKYCKIAAPDDAVRA